MSAATIQRLREAGVRLELRNGKLRLLGARAVIEQAVTPEVRNELTSDPAGLIQALRDEALAILERAVADENQVHRAWRLAHGERMATGDMATWLRDIAPDLLERIRLAEDEIDEAVLAGSVGALRPAIRRWRHRWAAARIGFEYFAGLREDE